MARDRRRWRRVARSRWSGWTLLALLTATPAGVEAGVTRARGFIASVYIAPQVSALWPYGTFHDLRWVLVYHRSWAGFVGESLAAIVARGLLCATLTAAAWPAQVPRPPLRRLVSRNLVTAAVLGAFLSPWAALGVVGSDVSLSWYVFGEIVPVVILAPFLQRAGMVPGWWRGLPPAGTVGLSLLNFVTLSAGCALVTLVPRPGTVAVAGAIGAVNGLLWKQAVRIAVVHEPVRLPRVPVAPIAVAVVIGLTFTAGWISDLHARPGMPSEPRQLAQLQTRVTGQPVIFLAGYNSQYDGQPSGYTLPILRYSYNGIDAAGRPRPYQPDATHQSLVTSAQLLAKQVAQVHDSTGRNVSLLAESEGALISRYYLTTMPHEAVTMLAMLSPPLRAGRIYYPPPNAKTGYGIATGWELRAIFGTLALTGGLPSTADEPFIRSLLDNAPLIRAKPMLCPVKGVKIIAFVPAADAAAVPPGIHPEIAVVHVTGVHGLLIDQPLTKPRLVAFLNDGRSEPHRRWDYSAIQRAGAAWQSPGLRVPYNPAWRNVAGHLGRDYQPDVCPKQ